MPELTIRREDPVEYLLKKRRQQTISHLTRQGQPASTAVAKAEEDELIYLVELENMSIDELQARYNAEKEQDRLAELDELEHQDSRRFFHQTDAAAHFDYWSKAAYWTLEEAVALTFGKEPTIVNTSTLEPYQDESLFAQRYSRTLELARRAARAEEFGREVPPGEFLPWALRNALPVPEALITLVQAQGKVVKNWEDEYLLVRQERDELAKLLSQLSGEGGAIPSLSEVSPYWRSFEQKTRHAIGEYTEWRASVRTVQKTKNLQDWLTDTIGADNREAEVIKKVLSDYFEDSL